MAGSNFNVGGLASGLDTNSIVDKLVAIESRPITKNTQQQTALNVQISSIGDLMAKLKALSTTAADLGKGVSASTVVTTPSGISATAGTGAIPGRYSVTVTTVAAAAKARSTGFATTSTTVAGGNLSLSIKGTAYTIAIAAGSDLGAVVTKINQSGAPINAAIVSDGTNYYVALTNRETGKPIGSGPTGGLTVTADPTGMGFAVTQDASNAVFSVDNLPIESQSNEVGSAIPGVTLTIKAPQLTASDLVIASDSGKSGTNVQGFVDGYNAIAGLLKQSLRPDPKNPPVAGTTLDGSTVLGLQRQLNGLLSTLAVPTGSFRTLTDLGIKLQSDGTLSLDKTKLSAALAKDSTAVDAVFSTASTGLAAKVSALSKNYTDTLDGLLVQRQTSLKQTIKDLSVSNQKLQSFVDNFKDNLLKRFSQMEKLISNYNNIGSFLANSSSFNNGSNS